MGLNLLGMARHGQGLLLLAMARHEQCLLLLGAVTGVIERMARVPHPRVCGADSVPSGYLTNGMGDEARVRGQRKATKTSCVGPLVP